jgi:hypothetical protein
VKKSAKNCTLYHVVNKPVWADIGAASTRSTNILVLHVLAAPIYWCYDVRSTNILVLLVLAAPIGEYTQTFYNIKIFADFLNVCSTNILVLTGLSTNIFAQYKENPIVCSTTPIRSNDAYSICWSKQKRK